MALTVRRVLGRMVLAAAAALAAITLVQRCEPDDARDVEVELDVDALPGVRAARVEVRSGRTVVAVGERRYDSGLPGSLRLRTPALGADGEVRVRLETDDGPREVRRPVTAAPGSVVTIRLGD